MSTNSARPAGPMSPALRLFRGLEDKGMYRASFWGSVPAVLVLSFLPAAPVLAQSDVVPLTLDEIKVLSLSDETSPDFTTSSTGGVLSYTISGFVASRGVRTGTGTFTVRAP